MLVLYGNCVLREKRLCMFCICVAKRFLRTCLELTICSILFKPHLNDSNTFWGHWSFTRRWFTADLYLFWHMHPRWPALLFRSLCSSKRHTCLDLNSSLFGFIAHLRCRKPCTYRGRSLQLFFNGFSVTCRGCISVDSTACDICQTDIYAYWKVLAKRLPELCCNIVKWSQFGLV